MTKPIEGGSRLAALAAEFETSGMSRREFCERHSLALSTLDYYRYRARQNKTAAVRLLPVSVMTTGGKPFSEGLAVVFANGRRIEFPHPFTESDLTQLMRAVEQA
jgi:hypothetical protein